MRDADRLSGIVFVSDMPWVKSTCGWGPIPPEAGRDNWLGATLPVAGIPYPKGIGTHAFEDVCPADVVLEISGQKFTTFKADVGPLSHERRTVDMGAVAPCNCRCSLTERQSWKPPSCARERCSGSPWM